MSTTDFRRPTRSLSRNSCLRKLRLGLAYLAGLQFKTASLVEVTTAQSDLVKDYNATRPLPQTFGNLSLESDPFVNAATKDSQLAVLHALFDPKAGYRLPGTYDKAKLKALFLDVRAGYFVKTEGIDEHIRREYHTFTHAIDIVVTTHGLLRGGVAVFLNEHEQIRPRLCCTLPRHIAFKRKQRLPHQRRSCSIQEMGIQELAGAAFRRSYLNAVGQAQGSCGGRWNGGEA
jgi:hypothetical protein